jgi:SAM-dependent methyltransferase
MDPVDELEAVRVRYARRQDDDQRYSLLHRAVLLAAQERQRAMADLFLKLGWTDLTTVRVLEVGCGTGTNLLELLRLGLSPDHLQGIELLAASAERARHVLPAAVRIAVGDASIATYASASQDVVLQSTVFSSLLDGGFQDRLAQAMWRWVRPGGGVLWYDLAVNNPANHDVRGIGVSRIRSLFPHGELSARRLTLAPPLARQLTRFHPSLYGLFNSCSWLRTHTFAWIQKSR